MILGEFCKEFKFDHTNKCYIHNPASVLQNDKYKLQTDFDIQTDHLISARRLYLFIINKKKKKEFEDLWTCCTGLPQSKIVNKWKEG